MKSSLKTAVRITQSNGATEKSRPYIRNSIHQKGEFQKSFFNKRLLCFYSVALLLRVSNAFSRIKASGFTLLEVMVALAIMAGVILTLLGSVNYHLGIIAKERDSTTLTLLARTRMAELEQAPVKGEGTFAPSHPELSWKAELLPADLPGLQKLVVKVRRGSDGMEVALVRYLQK